MVSQEHLISHICPHGSMCIIIHKTLKGCHWCLWCTINRKDMKVPIVARGPSPLPTLESLCSDHSAFLASGGNPKKAKLHHNVVCSAIFDIPLGQVLKKYI